jgi:hypothetical protein
MKLTHLVRLCIVLLASGSVLGLTACGRNVHSPTVGRQSLVPVVDVTTVGGLAIDFEHTTIPVVLSHFGKINPPAVTESITDNGCYIHYRHLRVTFAWFRTEQKCGYLYGVAAMADRWRTKRGLHVGEPVSVLKRLYPEARNEGTFDLPQFGVPPNSVHWYLSTTSKTGFQPILTAYSRGNRVTGIGVTFLGVGH